MHIPGDVMTVADDRPHRPGEPPTWQESVVMLAHDLESGLSLYFRVGAWPHEGSAQEWVYVETADGLRFRTLRPNLPLRPVDRTENGFGAGGLQWTVHDQGIHVVGDYSDLQVDLFFRDYYPSAGWPLLGRPTRPNDGSHGHLESSGVVEGVVSLAGRRFEIAGALAHRDHSWGPRDGRFRVARWCVGTTGPALSHSLISMIDCHGSHVRAGMVVRDGQVLALKDFDIVVHANMDGLTARAARARVHLEDDSTLDIDMSVRSSFITGNKTSHGGPGSYICSEGVFTSLVNGVAGAGCMTIANSVAGVGEEAKVVDPRFSTITHGLSWRSGPEPLLSSSELLSPARLRG